VAFVCLWHHIQCLCLSYKNCLPLPRSACVVLAVLFMMVFPLSLLPLELVLGIIGLATSPDANTVSRLHIYQTAKSLALVSYELRQIAMAQLLHTVIFNKQETINLFLRTLQQQEHFTATHSRLSLDYTELVHRIWSTECYEPFVQQPTSYFQDYRLLHDLFSRAESLGFHFGSLHLLYEALGGAFSEGLANWRCSRVTFAGDVMRWNSITSTRVGISFLQRITHLTVWVPNDDIMAPPSCPGAIPNWVRRVPFELMPNLTHFAFTLVSSPGSQTVPLLVYALPNSPNQRKEGSTLFRTWATSPDPFSYGYMCALDAAHPSNSLSIPNAQWELAFLRGLTI